ncbi:MAG TPA: hypothetical protein PK636_10745 [bacterium]|nr:hypothetical protein [bacterium]HPJ73154.1 hypothetical protein [bacterium]HPQ65446.1 hypothetical protein [bacterium]
MNKLAMVAGMTVCLATVWAEAARADQEVPGRCRPIGPPWASGMGFRAAPFKRELRELGRQIRANRHLSHELEERLEEMEPGPERDQVESMLENVHRDGAKLRIRLAREKLKITGKALAHARERHAEAESALAEIEETLARRYPGILDEVVPTPPLPPDGGEVEPGGSPAF